jgi:hypothetical protein
MNALSLPSIPDARLPRAYEAAQTALAQCQDVDECKDWSDKAAALASYAKQAKDEGLERMAQRIRARAIRRAGELLNQIEPARGANQNIEVGARPNVETRSAAAREVGFSSHQQKQAVRIAAVPEETFEREVEAPKPATLTQLAAQGIKPRPLVDLKGRDPGEFNRALHFVGSFEHYLRELNRQSIDAVLPCLNPEERARLRETINQIDAVHDRIMTRI